MSFQFAWYWMLATLPLPLAAAVLLPRAPELQGFVLRFPFHSALQAVASVGRPRLPRWRLGLGILAWVLLVVAAARPQFVGSPLRLPISGRDLMLAVDLSGSMATEDMSVNNRRSDRLTSVKAVAGEFIARREGDRIGLILFGRNAYQQAPLTFDRKTVRTLLEEAAIGLAGKETAIGDAIGLAVKRLRNQHQENRVLILLTDGANTAGSVDPLKAADLAAREGIRIYTLGVGADERVVRGIFGLRRISGTDLDEETLEAIAEKTGGQYFRARDIEGLSRVYGLLDQIEPLTQENETFRPIKELYFWPLSAALMVTLVMALASSGFGMRRTGAV